MERWRVGGKVGGGPKKMKSNLSVCLFVCMSVCFGPFVCLPECLSVFLSVFLSVYMFTWLCLCACPSNCLFLLLLRLLLLCLLFLQSAFTLILCLPFCWWLPLSFSIFLHLLFFRNFCFIRSDSFFISVLLLSSFLLSLFLYF